MKNNPTFYNRQRFGLASLILIGALALAGSFQGFAAALPQESGPVETPAGGEDLPDKQTPSSKAEAPYLPLGGDRAHPLEATGLVTDSILPASTDQLLASWSEGFDDISLLPGLGWAFINNSDPLGTTGWFQGNTDAFLAHSGADNSYIGANYNNTAGTGTISNWLLTPELTMNNGDRLTFYTRRRTASPWEDRLQVRLSTNGASTNVGTTATSLGDFSTLLLDINPTYAAGGYPQVWTQFEITLSGLSGATNGRLAFRYFVENGGPTGTNSDYIGIDTLEYEDASEPPTLFAYINQPWDWIDGIADPGATLNATLRRGGSTFATASTTSDANGIFSLHFRSGGNHVNLIVGDEVIITGGGLSANLTLNNISGSINIGTNQIAGQATGGVFPAQGVASVGRPADIGYTTQSFSFAADGSFLVDFDGIFDIDANHLAKVNYTDPNGNMVVQLFNPIGLDIRALISEGRIEGVTTPGETVSVLVSDEDGPKASASAVADETGFYTTLVHDRGYEVDLKLGDHIEVMNSTLMRSTTLRMFHASYLQPWNDRIVGNILGVNIPAENLTGRIDLWSVAEQKWYTQYIGIGPYGAYGADFSGIVDMMEPDIVRVWVTLPDGHQQAALGWGLHLGVSTSNNEIWGYTTANSSVEVRLYRGLDDGQPVDLIGAASTTAQPSGYFSTTVLAGGSAVEITPSNVVVVQAGGHLQTFFVGQISAGINVTRDRMTIRGPANSILHIEGRRAGVLREDAVYQDDYVWREITLDSTGTTTVDLSTFDIQIDDNFDLTCYIMEHGLALHTAVKVPVLYLPILLRILQ